MLVRFKGLGFRELFVTSLTCNKEIWMGLHNIPRVELGWARCTSIRSVTGSIAAFSSM